MSTRACSASPSLLGRADLDPTADASALTTADVGARGHPFSAALHASAPPGTVVPARVWFQRLGAVFRGRHESAAHRHVGTPRTRCAGGTSEAPSWPSPAGCGTPPLPAP